jgi:hypothetical protein
MEGFVADDGSTSVPMDKYVDGKFAEIQRAVDLALAAMEVQGVPLREYIEAVLEESKRALEMAEREREKAAVALREQTQKALDKADAEREKAASALRTESQRALDKADSEREKSAAILRQDLANAIQQGDTNLLSHIHQEIARISEQLQSADKLELSRVQQVEDLARSVQRELMLVQAAAKAAIDKAEVATDKRFEGVNELREQMNDLILAHQQSINTLTEKLMLREVADAQFKELRMKIEDARNAIDSKLPREVFDRTVTEWSGWRAAVDKRLATSSGRQHGAEDQRTSSDNEAQMTIMRVGLVVSIVALLVTIVLASNGVI